MYQSKLEKLIAKAENQGLMIGNTARYAACPLHHCAFTRMGCSECVIDSPIRFTTVLMELECIEVK